MEIHVLCLIFAGLCHVLVAYTDLGDLGCSDTVQKNNKCKMDEICVAQCLHPCHRTPDIKIYGTVVYAQKSPICKAAVHDLRISTWNTGARNVLLKRIPRGGPLYGSSRFGFTSNWDSGSSSKGNIVFLSPRVSERILDVYSVHRNYLYGEQQNHTQECFISANETTTTVLFDIYLERTHPPKNYTFNPGVMIGNVLKYKIDWPSNLQRRSNGGYQCIPNKSMLSIITSLAMWKDAHFMPAALTVTASVGENITLRMNEVSSKSVKMIWKKDSRTINDYIVKNKSGIRLTLPAVQIGSAGIYSLEYAPVPDNMARAALTRLIVRTCPKKQFGENCTSTCPECENGGVCHDITGVCVCPPGFNGTLCENACKPGSFGNMCNMCCFKHGVSSDIDLSCQGLLICAPDPYGCSCAPGFKNISCDIVCDPGEYGAGCSQHRICHCASGNPCDIYSGLCHNGCDNGWHSLACNISYPVFRQRPHILNATSTSVIFSFGQWNESIDEGVGKPSSYAIVYKKTEQAESWLYGPHFPSQSFDKIQIVTLQHLEKGTMYTIAIIVVDISGQKQLENLSSTNYSTLCGKAESPPVDIKAEATETQVNVSWKLPPKMSWNCRSISVWLMYESNYCERKEVEVYNSFYTFSTKSFTLWNITVCVAPEGDYPSNTNCANTLTITSEEGTPGPISDIQFELQEPRVMNLSWKEPEETNGIIRYYIVRYQQISWTYNCDLRPDLTIHEVNATSNSILLTPLIPSSDYYVNVSAVTSKQGPGTITNVRTDIDDPDGIVRDISLINEQIITWEPPFCNVTYGYVAYYNISMFGQESWDSCIHNFTANFSHLMLSQLVPFSKYLAKIYVANKHGVSTNYAGFNFTTKSAAPPQPTGLTVYSKTSNSLSFSWKPPYPPYGELDHYIIRYVVQAKITKTVASPTNAICKDAIRKDYHCFSITDLKANQEYKISVSAYNLDVAVASPSATVLAETIESTPEEPSFVSVHNRTDTEIDLQWEEPYVTNGNLTNFRVNLTILKSFSTPSVSVTVNSNVTDVAVRHYTFTHLAPATVYKACVEASTNIGYGQPKCVTFNTSNSKPVIDAVPLLQQKTEDKIVVKIFPVKSSGGPISAYFIVVDPISHIQRSKRRISPDMLDAQPCPSKSHPINRKYIAAKIQNVPNDGLIFTVGDGKCAHGFYNAPLKHGVEYKIGIAVLSQFGNEIKYSEIKYMPQTITISEKETHHVGAIFGFVIPLLIIIIIMAVFIYVKKPKWLYENRRLKAMKMKILPKNIGFFSNSNEALAVEMEDEDIVIETESVTEELSNRISVKQLEAYVQRSLLNGTIRKECMSLPRGQKFPCNHAKLPANKVKNRYGNLLPYDCSRVILSVATTETNSDYINANYIDGYKYPRKYIATQGPKQETIDDFWRMVWGEGSCKILMVTNLTEGGKSKCSKYWPDGQQIDINPFDDFTVAFIEAEQYADFIIRTFHISKHEEIREVKQFHFQTWPDHGIPMYSPPVVSYLKKVSLYQPNNKKPIIIHCSAGIGRTGTLILLDSMMDMGKTEGYVDVLYHLNVMRHQRASIVENVDQYSFVYNTLVETLCGIDTCIPCSEFFIKLSVLRASISEDGLSHLEKEFQVLTKQKPSIAPTETKNALQAENQSKNRDPKILPPDRARPILMMNALSVGSDYINAVYVNGYRQKDAYLVTQYPLPNTIYDFWRMVCESKSRTIVLLQSIEFSEMDSASYWPDENNVFVYEGFKIKCQSANKEDKISVWNFALYPDSGIDGPPLLTSLYQLHTWQVGEDCPTDSDLILTLLDQVERRQQQLGKHKITLQCFDGAAACGIFCATSFLCDKIKTEQDIDVFQAVKSIRTNRPEFINNMEQYNFLYDIAETFLEKFELYANFQ